MAVIDAGGLHPGREARQELRTSRHLPLYVAGLLGGVALVIGGDIAVDRVHFGGGAEPSAVRAPVIATYDGPELGQPARTATPEARLVVPNIGGTLEAEVLTDADLAVPAAPIVAEPAIEAPVAPAVESAPLAPVQPAAAVPLNQPQAQSAPVLTVPEPQAAPEVPAPEAVAPAPAVPETSNFYVPAVTGGPMTNLEQRLFDGLNAERIAAGMAPYTYDAGLSTIARTRSQQMVDQGYFGHKDPFGYSMYVELLAYFGYTSYAWAGENLAVNNYAEAESPERAVASLMNSPTHKANILQTVFTRVGIGEVTHADGRKFYTMIFLS